MNLHDHGPPFLREIAGPSEDLPGDDFRFGGYSAVMDFGAGTGLICARQVDLIVSAMAMHHVEDTNRLLQAFAQHLAPGGRVALADLDSEDGSFHPPDTEGGVPSRLRSGCLA